MTSEPKLSTSIAAVWMAGLLTGLFIMIIKYEGALKYWWVLIITVFVLLWNLASGYSGLKKLTQKLGDDDDDY